MDWEVHFGAPGKVFDVTVSSMFRTTLPLLVPSNGFVGLGHTGIVLAPSVAILSLRLSSALPACALLGSGGFATSRLVVLAAINSPSRRFHSARTSADGAHPRIPG